MEKMKPRIRSLNDLFANEEVQPYPNEVSAPAVQTADGKNGLQFIAPKKIRTFNNHPFRLYDGERLDDLVESVKANGILIPTIVRKIEKDENGYEYEMLAGHNRQNAAIIAELEVIPCIVKENINNGDRMYDPYMEFIIDRESQTIQADGTKTFEKAQIFYKATIHPRTIPTSADTAVEALYISLNTRLRVDLRYMSQLTGKQPIDVINELGDRIFLNPQKYSGNILDGWETAEEYLSGHVQDKLVYAEYYAEKEPDLFSRNVRALEEAQPVPLGPSDINAPVGAPWIPIEYYRQFMYETFDTPSEYR